MIAWLAACVAPGEVRYPDQVVVRVPVDDPDDVAALYALGDVWSEHVVDSVDLRLPRSRLAALDRYEVLVPSVQDAIDTSRPQIDPPPGFWEDWQPLDAFDAHLDTLAARSADAEVVEIGVSVEGRPIRGLQIGLAAADDRLGILVTGGQHAREWVGASSAMWIAEHLVDGDGVDPEVTALLDRYRVVVVPVANPDGYHYTWTTDRVWRKNRSTNGDGTRGVDLNRNWDAAWGGPGSSGVPSSDNYRGPAPFSEAESEAISVWVLDHPRVGLYLDLHCTGQVALHPFAFTATPAPDPALLSDGSLAAADAMQAVHGRAYDAGAFHTRLYAADGVAIDWAYGTRGLGAWLFELRDHGQYGFLLPADQIVPTGEEAWAGFLALADTTERPRLALALAGALVVDGLATAEIVRAEAGAPIEVYGSTTGYGTTVLPDGTSLGLADATRLADGFADPRGRSDLAFRVPVEAAGGTLWVQARSAEWRSIVATVAIP